jgi:hypothetical protein
VLLDERSERDRIAAVAPLGFEEDTFDFTAPGCSAVREE